MVVLNELMLGRLLRALTVRRISNIAKTSLSFALSAVWGEPVVWGIPPVLTVEPTNMCNLHCPLCTTGAGEMRRSAGRMSLTTFQKIIDKLGDDIFFLLIYHQGEPYMNKHFFDFVEMAKQKNVYVTTSTNGHYFTEQNIKKTLNCGLDSMIISVDGTDQQSYEKYRSGGQLEKVLQGTKNLIEARKMQGKRTPNIALQFLVMKHNEHQLSAVKRLAEDLGVDRLLIKNIEVRSLEEAARWLPADERFRRYDLSSEDFIVKGSDKKSCSRPWSSTLINWDGTFVPCCFDKNGSYPMGNINGTDEIDEIWKGSDFSTFRANLLRDRKQIDICRNCNQGFGSFLPQKLWKNKSNNSK
jgi:radical SAM protein with 4Fe4S-binding SPASM domain